MVAFILRMAWEFAPGADAQERCTTVETFTGQGIRSTQPFEVTSDTWRISYEYQSDTPDASLFQIFVYDADTDEPVTVISLERPGSDTSFVNAGAGRYYLDINSANASWSVTVEGCSEAAPPGGSVPPTQEEQYQEPAQQYGELGNGTLMKAGGPSNGPVPLMPGGSCPVEYPVKKDGACHR